MSGGTGVKKFGREIQILACPVLNIGRKAPEKVKYKLRHIEY